MDQPTTKAALLERVRRERADWERLLAEVGEARMEEPGPMGQWTFKDLQAHLTAWQRHGLAPLERPCTASGRHHPGRRTSTRTATRTGSTGSSTRRPTTSR